MSVIAADVGLSEGGLLHHFPSKKHLLLAVSEHRIESSATWWDKLSPDACAQEILGEMVAATARHLEQPGLIELFVMVSAEAVDQDSPAHQLYAERYDEVVSSLVRLLSRAQARGELVPGVDCETVARECIAVYDGLQLQWVLSEGRLDLLRAVREHINRLATTIIVPTSGTT